MPKKSGLIFIIALVAVIAVVAWRSSSLVQGFAYKQDMTAAALATLIALIAVSLFVERGMTVINAILYGEEQRDVEVGLAQGTASVEDLARVLGAKERVRLLGAFIAALFVSAAGVRTLEGLLDTGAAGHPHNSLLIPVDVVLTAALIAGGSNGLAYLLQLAKNRLGSGSSATPVQPPVPRGRGLAPAPANGVDPAMRALLTTTG